MCSDAAFGVGQRDGGNAGVVMLCVGDSILEGAEGIKETGS